MGRCPVDPNGTGVDGVGEPHRTVGIGGEDGGVQPVVSGVRQGNGRCFVADARHDGDWTELFLLEQPGVVRHVREEGRFDRLPGALTTPNEGRAAADGVRDEVLDVRRLALTDQWTDRRLLVEEVAGPPVVHLRGDQLHEVVVDRLVRQHPRDGRTPLAGVLERSRSAVGRGVVEVGVREDEHRGVATEFHVEVDHP